ncbi:hypothetical protein F4809DRAFT_43087 [Biscogniauxia mediterranea]|nr:hypothetical protein F4809DRAFT_43087 [Biscogniauxia mediterranea]
MQCNAIPLWSRDVGVLVVAAAAQSRLECYPKGRPWSKKNESLPLSIMLPKPPGSVSSGTTQHNTTQHDATQQTCEKNHVWGGKKTARIRREFDRSPRPRGRKIDGLVVGGRDVTERANGLKKEKREGEGKKKEGMLIVAFSLVKVFFFPWAGLIQVLGDASIGHHLRRLPYELPKNAQAWLSLLLHICYLFLPRYLFLWMVPL